MNEQLSYQKEGSKSPIETSFDNILYWGIKNRNRNAYFAALYKNITQRVSKAIANREFEDNERMRLFVQHFAEYYIDAFHKYSNNQLEKENPWYDVFEIGNQKLSVVQHMLLGVNTHINYDLPN